MGLALVVRVERRFLHGRLHATSGHASMDFDSYIHVSKSRFYHRYIHAYEMGAFGFITRDIIAATGPIDLYWTDVL